MDNLKLSDDELIQFGGIQYLANLLAHNSSITRLDICNLLETGFGDEEAKFIAQLYA
jgi:hypothetical protein